MQAPARSSRVHAAHLKISCPQEIGLAGTPTVPMVLAVNLLYLGTMRRVPVLGLIPKTYVMLYHQI
jgi:hypothetical protein